MREILKEALNCIALRTTSLKESGDIASITLVSLMKVLFLHSQDFETRPFKTKYHSIASLPLNMSKANHMYVRATTNRGTS